MITIFQNALYHESLIDPVYISLFMISRKLYGESYDNAYNITKMQSLTVIRPT